MNLQPNRADRQQRLLFGRAVHTARHSLGWSQQGLGQMAWLSQSTISRLEGGTLEGIRYSTLMRLFRAMGVVEIRLEARPHGWYAELIARYDGDTHDAAGLPREPENGAPENGAPADAEEGPQSPS